MFVIIGALIVIGSVAGGCLMEGGQPLVVLNQPAEFLIIGGAAVGRAFDGYGSQCRKREFDGKRQWRGIIFVRINAEGAVVNFGLYQRKNV